MTYLEAERRAKQMSPAERQAYMVAVGFNPGLVRQMGKHFTYYVALALCFTRADRKYWVGNRNRQWVREQNAI